MTSKLLASTSQGFRCGTFALVLALVLLSGLPQANAAQTVILAAGQTAATSSDVVVASNGTLTMYPGSIGGLSIDLPVYQVANSVEVKVGDLTPRNPGFAMTQPGTYRVKRPDITASATNVGVTSDLSSGSGGGAVTQATSPWVVDGSAVTQPVSGTFWQATQPVSGTLTTNATQSGTWTVQPGNTPNTTAWKVDGSAVTQPVSGTFWQATQPVSVATAPVLVAGSAVIGKVGIDQTTPGTTNAIAIPDITASGNITTQNLVSAGTATAGSAVLISVSGQNTVGIQVTGIYTGALTPQATVDGTTWVTLTAVSLVQSSGSTVAIITSSTQSVYTANVAGWSAFRITGLAAMTGTATVSLRATNAQTGGFVLASANTNLAAGTLLAADVGVQYRATSTGGALIGKVLTAATTNATNLKASAGRLLGWDLCNVSAATKFIRFHNLAVAPTVGTSSPMFYIGIPTLQCNSHVVEGGIAMTAGVAFSVTGAAGDLDATATAAGDVVGEIIYQ